MRSFFRNKPVKEPITDTHELLRQIERKDAAFRIAQSTFLALIIVFLGILLSATYRLQRDNNTLLKAQSVSLSQQKATTDQLKANDKHSAQSLQSLQNHIDCIVNLFTKSNRASLTITDINTCQLTVSSSGGATGSTKSGPVNVPQTPQNSPTPSQAVAATTNPAKTTPKPKHPLICSLTLTLIGC